MAESQQIEILTWGRGIHRIFEACRKEGSPEPKLSLSGHDLWTEFPFSEQYLAALDEKTEKTSEKTSEKILNLIRENNQVTIATLSEKIGVSTRSIERNIKNLQENGALTRKGPDKGGHWEVLEG